MASSAVSLSWICAGVKSGGAVYNPTSDFVISEDGRSAPALVLFDSREGTISGWNPAVDPDHAILMVDNSAELSTAYNHAMYSGLHIDQNSKGQNVLYAADRGHNRIDMFDGQFHFLGSFTDPNVSVQSLGRPGAWQVEDAGDGKLFVLFTMDLGRGKPYGGIVDIFDGLTLFRPYPPSARHPLLKSPAQSLFTQPRLMTWWWNSLP